MSTKRKPAELKRPADIDTSIETGVALHKAWEEIDRLREEVRSLQSRLEEIEFARRNAVIHTTQLAAEVEKYLQGERGHLQAALYQRSASPAIVAAPPMTRAERLALNRQ
jgi:hypothetical protein